MKDWDYANEMQEETSKMLTLSKFGIGIVDNSFFSGEDIGNLFNFIHDVAKTMRQIDTRDWGINKVSENEQPEQSEYSATVDAPNIKPQSPEERSDISECELTTADRPFASGSPAATAAAVCSPDILTGSDEVA